MTMKCEACRGYGLEQVYAGHGNIDVVDCSACYGSGILPAFSIVPYDGVSVLVVQNGYRHDYYHVETIGLDGVE